MKPLYAAPQPASNVYISRTWDIALSERVMQFETAGVYKLSCKQILGLIAFVRDGEGSVVTSTQHSAPGVRPCPRMGCLEVVGDTEDPGWDQGQCGDCGKWFWRSSEVSSTDGKSL